jgi:hypothetical protein
VILCRPTSRTPRHYSRGWPRRRACCTTCLRRRSASHCPATPPRPLLVSANSAAR